MVLAVGACVGDIAGGGESPATSSATLESPGDVTLTFDDFESGGTPVTGEYGGIHWTEVSGGWMTWFDGDDPQAMTIYVNNLDTSEVTATFELPEGMVLKSVEASSYEDLAATVKFSSPGNPERVWNDIGAPYQTLTLDWTVPASLVTVKVTCPSTYGAADLVFDNLVYGPADGTPPPPPPPDLEDPSDGVEWEPIDLATTRQLRDSFDWNATSELSEAPVHEITVDGEVLHLPAIHYAIVYVRNPHELRELEEIGVHHDLVPLFDSEWPQAETSLVLSFNGDLADGGGMFAFALMPAITYNALRAESLAGEDTFRAVILRDVPAEADAGDGTVSWDFILQNMKNWAPPRSQLTDDGEVVPPIEDEAAIEDKRLGRFLRRALRRVRDVTRGAIDLVRQGIGAVANAVLPSTDLIIETSVNDRTFAPLVRGWDQTDDGDDPTPPRGFGERLTLRGVRVYVQGRLTVYPGTLNEHGSARITVPRGVPVNVCFEADSPAATFERGLLRSVMHCWHTHTPRGGSDTISRAVGDTEFYVMAQLIDARDYAREVLHITPPKATIQTGEVVGEVLTSGDAGNAFVPCLAATRAPVSIVEAYGAVLNVAGWTVGGIFGLPGFDLGLPVEFVFSTDIVMNKETRSSRNTPVHEYGHFVFCTLLANTQPLAFDTVWSQVLSINNLTGSSPVRALNEGFADWFTSQVVGGTNYFAPPGSTGEDPGRNPGDDPVGHKFDGHLAPTSGEGMETNYGGPPCGAPPCIDMLTLDATDRVVSTVATILHDSIDRDDCGDSTCRAEGRNDGAVWDSSTRPFTPATPFTLDHVGDEEIALSPSDVMEAVRLFASRVEPLTYANFYSALRDIMLERDYTEEQICQLFALHSSDGNCSGWPDGSSTSHEVTYRRELEPPEPGVRFGAIETIDLGGCTPAGCPPDPRCAGSTCRITAGTDLTLRAVPEPGFEFVWWNGWGGTACQGARTPEVTLTYVSADTECIAIFRRASYLVTGNASGNGVVLPDIARVAHGAPHTLEATPATGHVFVGWSGSPECTGPNPLPIPAVTRDVACTATFAPTTLRVSAMASTGGDIEAPTSRDVPYNGSARFTARPRTGYHFVDWTGGPQCTGGPTLDISPVTSNVTCTANFALNQWNVSATWSSGGTVSPTSRIVNHGGSVTLTATHTSGHRFSHWTGSAQCTGTTPTLDIRPVTSNVSCRANFTTLTFTVRASGSTGGTASPSLVTVNYDGSTTIQATPNPGSGYSFVDWAGSAQCNRNRNATLVITPVRSDVFCIANFAFTGVTVSFAPSSGGGGTIATSGTPAGSCSGSSCTLPSGSTLTLTAQPSSGHLFAGWSGCSTQPEPVLRLSNVTSNQSCTATFIRVRRITYSAPSPAWAEAEVRFGSACTGGVCNVVDGGGVNLYAYLDSWWYYLDGWRCTEAGTGQVLTSVGDAYPQYLSIIDARNDWSCQVVISSVPW